MARTSAPANRARLRWARTHAGLSIDEAAKLVKVTPTRLVSWEEGDASPTINQLRNIARTYRQTIASFLAPGPAPEVGPGAGSPPDFRGVGAEEAGSIPVLRREIDRALDRRAALLLLQPEPSGRLSYLPSILADPGEAALQFQREARTTSSRRFRDSREALALWIGQIEQLGVLVFQMSRVDPDNCRGISLWNDVYPVIVLNGADEPEGRLFTLLHETAHLLARQSGICGVLTGPEVETRCNEFAGAVLLPESELLDELGAQEPVNALSRLAKTFRVSQSAVVIRLRSLGVVDQATLSKQLGIAIGLARERREQAREEAKRKKSGPPHHLTQLRNLGSQYVGTVLDALDSHEITAVDAAYYLESKLPTVDRMRTELARRSAPEAIDDFVMADGQQLAGS